MFFIEKTFDGIGVMVHGVSINKGLNTSAP